MPNLFEKFKLVQENRYKDKIKKHPYPTKNKFHLGSFLDATNGFVWALKTQPNFAVEIITFILLAYLYLFLRFLGIKIDHTEIIIITALGGVLFASELFNTSLEALSDEVAKGEYKDFIRISKDTSAAAVLVTSITWIIIVVYTFVPKVLELIYYLW